MAWTTSDARRSRFERRETLDAIGSPSTKRVDALRTQLARLHPSSAGRGRLWLALGALHIGLLCMTLGGQHRLSAPADGQSASASVPTVLDVLNDGSDALVILTALLFVATAPWLGAMAARPGRDQTAAVASSMPTRDVPMATRALHHSRGLEQLAQRMSHDLRTPLNAVIGFSEIMSREIHGPVGNARYREYAAHIERSGKEILQATEETLAVTRLMASPPLRGRQTTFSAATVASDLCRSARRAGQANADIATSFADPLPVSCELEAFSAAFIRIIEAIGRHGNTASPIEARGMRVEETGHITIGYRGARGGRSMVVQRGFPTVEEDFALCLARMMLELQGMHLDWAIDADGLPAATLHFTCAIQESLPLEAA